MPHQPGFQWTANIYMHSSSESFDRDYGDFIASGNAISVHLGHSSTGGLLSVAQIHHSVSIVLSGFTLYAYKFFCFKFIR